MIWIALPEWLSHLLHRERPPQQDLAKPDRNRKASNPIADVDMAMEELRLYSFEREILSAALTAIYEAEVKGILKVEERDRLSERYKRDLQILDERIEERRRVTDFVNLQKEKRELQEEFSQKISEVDRKIEELRSLIGSLPQPEPYISSRQLNSSEKVTHSSEQYKETEDTSPGQKLVTSNRMRTRTDEKIETIREEVLKAIERLEQIESEG